MKKITKGELLFTSLFTLGFLVFVCPFQEFDIRITQAIVALISGFIVFYFILN